MALMLIGLTGYKGSGKDAAARFLMEERGYVRLAFADKLKEAVANLFGMTVDEVDLLKNRAAHVRVTMARDSSNPGMPYSTTVQFLYWREFLQRFGTEMGRETFGQDFWIELWYDTYASLFLEDRNVVVTDVRFPNEGAIIHDCNGYVFQINRPGYEPDGHASEEPLDNEYIDATIDNSGSLDELRDLILAAERMHASDKPTRNAS